MVDKKGGFGKLNHRKTLRWLIKNNVVSASSTTGKSAVFDKKDVVSTSSTTGKTLGG
ncbi:MAG: hypothetical protein MR494_03865 [Spirochaetia bacterium]|nr:hypothetical protein [Spirochaetia bacterium]